MENRYLHMYYVVERLKVVIDWYLPKNLGVLGNLSALADFNTCLKLPREKMKISKAVQKKILN